MADLAEIAIRLDTSLLRNQKEYENAIVTYGKACEVYAQKLTAYRKKRGELTVSLKEKYPATIVPDIVKGETAQLKGEAEAARLNVRKCEHWINAYENRINSAKFIGNKIKKITGEN